MAKLPALRWTLGYDTANRTELLATARLMRALGLRNRRIISVLRSEIIDEYHKAND